MAANQIPAPAPMSLKENWKNFESAWGYYILATGLKSKLKKEDNTPNVEGMQQVAATLCAVMGAECLKIMNSIPTLTELGKQNPDTIIEALKKHFIPQRHVLFERCKFNTATQKEESVDEFVVRLRQLAEPCEFGDLKDSLIRDRLVIGTTDSSSRDRLVKE